MIKVQRNLQVSSPDMTSYLGGARGSEIRHLHVLETALIAGPLLNANERAIDTRGLHMWQQTSELEHVYWSHRQIKGYLLLRVLVNRSHGEALDAIDDVTLDTKRGGETTSDTMSPTP